MRFDGGPPDGPQIVIDGDQAVGPSPMDLVLIGVAGCMGIDIQDILVKGRVPLEGIEIMAHGQRAEETPKRFTAIQLIVTVQGVPPEDRGKVERAVRLSEEKYCSVLHSIRQDIPVDIVIEGV